MIKQTMFLASLACAGCGQSDRLTEYQYQWIAGCDSVLARNEPGTDGVRTAHLLHEMGCHEITPEQAAAAKDRLNRRIEAELDRLDQEDKEKKEK